MEFKDLKRQGALAFLFCLIITICFLALPISEVKAQGSFNTADLSTVKSSQISDTQLKSYISKGKAEGLTAEQALDLARQRGLSASESAILSQRIREMELTSGGTEVGTSVLRSPLDLPESSPAIEPEKTKGPMIFGSHLFSNEQLNFEPSLNIPTPVNYVLGAGDEIVVDIWGASTNLYQLQVGPEGTVVIDNVGPIYVHGLTLEEGEKRIIAKLKQLYRGLRPGEAGQDTYARVSLGRVRTIQVTVLGEVRNPGNYTVSSLTTVFNALFQAGGLNSVGSYRDVQVIRDNKKVTDLDIYDFLLYGDQKDNIRLNDQDVIRVGVYGTRVEIRGEVKRPGLYEIIEGEKLSDLISNAGSFSDDAYTRQIKIERNTDKERQIVRVERESYPSFELKNGDVVSVGGLLSRFENRVTIEGAVWRPGEYELTEGLTLSQLIEKADGLKPEAYKSRGIIYRLSDIHDFYVEAFNVEEVVQHPEQYDIELQYEDRIVIKDIYEMREDLYVSLKGEIQSGGNFKYQDNMTLGDLILAGDGFKTSASEARVEVYRRIMGEAAPQQRGDAMAESFVFSVSRDLILEGDAKDFRLQPFDQVYVRR